MNKNTNTVNTEQLNNNKEIRIFWTGGWDSTFRIVELSQKNVIVQPIYVEDEYRISKEKEIKAMNKIMEALKKKEKTLAEFKPIKIIKKEEVPENEEITNAYISIHNETKLGSQYDWLARIANQEPYIEIGLEETEQGLCTQSIKKFGKLITKEGINYIDKEKSTRELNLVLGNFSFPIINKTEKQMAEIIKKEGYEDIMKNIWFCHNPIHDEPCGFCNPCVEKIKSEMEFLLPKSAIKRYKMFKNLRRIFGEEVTNKLKRVYRKIKSL